jgi:probable F420-dependent oxidoreductase
VPGSKFAQAGRDRGDIALKRLKVMKHAIKFGLFLPTGDYAQALNAARRADALGYYSVSINDHMMSLAGDRVGNRAVPQLECYVTLSAVAARTERVRILPTITPIGFRNPALLAKMLCTLDHVSNGRVIAGLGAGWWRDEYTAYDYSYLANSERIDQLAEGIAILKAMWTREPASFAGRYYRIENAYNSPKPVQKPYPPIMVGGSGPKILALAAQEADIVNLVFPNTSGQNDLYRGGAAFSKAVLRQRVDTVRAHCRDINRDFEEIEIGNFVLGLVSENESAVRQYLEAIASAQGFKDAAAVRQTAMTIAGTPAQVIRELRDRIETVGATYFIFNFADLASIEVFGKKVIPEFRQN